jgi:hypothetical protein
MRRYFAIAAALALTGAAPVAQTPATGTIVGRVVLTSRVKGTGLPSTIYQPRAVAIHVPATTPEISNVVVSLRGVALGGPLPIVHRDIRQVHEEFVPRVVAVTKGSTVSFPNADPIFHNVFSLASAASFDLGRYPKGRSKSATLTRSGVVKVYCHIHSQMSATILVLDNPYFTTPELDGTFRLGDVPPGTYTIVGWHERVGERIARVTVTAGGTTTVDLSLPVEDEP